ncbi:glutamate-rich protein 2 isoform X1 [Malaclemys terrapin pileata]|uniref:glutamate-rich protein 2 isoform X1 n=2 Tax=Malaclemys terrapin pileata TaxID=2991368 RepID=UPI0023A7BB5A|nr:glutamate-rich protein 2 isoform X1 [Malaclemys terrapin pileata]
MNRCNAVWGPGTPRTTTPKVSGMLEVVGPDDGFILEACLTMSRQNCLERTGAIKDQKNGQNGRLHVFGPKEEVIIEPIQTMPCPELYYRQLIEWSMCRRTGEYSQHGWGTNQHGFGPESTNKVYTPTKQISLCAAKSTFEKWDASAKIIKKKTSSRIQETNLRSPQYIQETTDDKEKNSRNIEKPANNELSTEFPTNSIEDHNTDEQLSETTDDDESSSENEDRKINAPIELLGEFLKAIMDQDYSLSKKLCQMILIYEPENTEAKQFLPLLEEKLLIESTQNFGDEEGEETDEGSSENSEEDTSSSDSSDDDGEESSGDSDENV